MSGLIPTCVRTDPLKIGESVIKTLPYQKSHPLKGDFLVLKIFDKNKMLSTISKMFVSAFDG